VNIFPVLSWLIIAAAFPPYDPFTSKAATGADVPIPKLPLVSIVRATPDAYKSLMLPLPTTPPAVNFARRFAVPDPVTPPPDPAQFPASTIQIVPPVLGNAYVCPDENDPYAVVVDRVFRNPEFPLNWKFPFCAIVNSVAPDADAVNIFPVLSWLIIAAAFPPYDPFTSKAATGADVPIPKLPLVSIVRATPDAYKSLMLPLPTTPPAVNFARRFAVPDPVTPPPDPAQFPASTIQIVPPVLGNAYVCPDENDPYAVVVDRVFRNPEFPLNWKFPLLLTANSSVPDVDATRIF